MTIYYVTKEDIGTHTHAYVTRDEGRGTCIATLDCRSRRHYLLHLENKKGINDTTILVQVQRRLQDRGIRYDVIHV